MNILYYLTLLFLPTQLGKHFWPTFAFIKGIRVDYLSPTLYITDIFIFILFCWVLWKKKTFFQSFNRRFLLFFGLFLLDCSLGIILSSRPLAGWYGIVKLLEFTFFALYTKSFFISKKKQIITSSFFCIAVLFESLLTFFEFFHHGSINGIFYFFGERYYTAATPGIANASLHGELVLRPYATFSHPNVLAAFLLLTMIFILLSKKEKKKKVVTPFLLLTFFVGTVALFLTLSRVAILIWMIIFCLTVFYKIRIYSFGKNVFILLLLLVGIITLFSLSPLSTRFFGTRLSDESITVREALMQDALHMTKTHPLVGVGLNNFYVSLPPSSFSPLFLFQPVHNIFLLVLSETGLIGFIFLMVLVYRTAAICLSQKSVVKIVLLGSVCLLGSFDHYFLTLQQGQLLLAFVIGFCWSKA